MAQKIDLNGNKLQMGLAKLVLVVVELLRQILERQAERRISSNTLSEEEVERLGLAFIQIKEKIAMISNQFGLKQNELDNALKGMVRSKNSQMTSASIVDIVDRLLVKGVVIGGKVTISVADIDLVALDLLATLSATPNIQDKICKPRKND